MSDSGRVVAPPFPLTDVRLDRGYVRFGGDTPGTQESVYQTLGFRLAPSGSGRIASCGREYLCTVTLSEPKTSYSSILIVGLRFRIASRRFSTDRVPFTFR